MDVRHHETHGLFGQRPQRVGVFREGAREVADFSLRARIAFADVQRAFLAQQQGDVAPRLLRRFGVVGDEHNLPRTAFMQTREQYALERTVHAAQLQAAARRGKGARQFLEQGRGGDGRKEVQPRHRIGMCRRGHVADALAASGQRLRR